MVEGDPEAENNFYNLSNYLKNSPVKYGEPAIERLGLEEYYPDINTPLQVGNYSGSNVSSMLYIPDFHEDIKSQI